MANSIFKKKGKIIQWLILASFILIFFNVAYAAEKKHGAVLLMTTQDGQNIKGELLAVKEATLILLDLVTSEGIEVDIDKIRHIRIVRKSKILQAMGKSLLIGAGSGALLGFLDGDDSGGWFSMTAEEKALFGAVVFQPNHQEMHGKEQREEVSASRGHLVRPGQCWRAQNGRKERV